MQAHLDRWPMTREGATRDRMVIEENLMAVPHIVIEP